MLDSEQRKRICAAGLFDAAFYRKHYARAQRSDDEALDHFLGAGLELGYLPSPAFDPVLYRMLVPECADANPLLHSLASGVPFQPLPLPELFPEVARATFFRNAGGKLQTLRNRSYARDAASARGIPLAVGGADYSLTVPEPAAFMDRLRAGPPFAFARLPEGFWETLWILRACESALSEDPRARVLAPAPRHAFAVRLCAALHPKIGNFAPLFVDEVLSDIRSGRDRPGLLRGVAFKGYPTFEESYSGPRSLPPREELLRIFADHFAPGETLYDATLWKRLLIAGPLRELPAICRGRPVVLIGPAFLATLGERWSLERFAHVEIPINFTQYERHDLLERASRAVDAARALRAGPPMVLTQCGAALAYWLIVRLLARDSAAFYLDIGQALDGWLFDICRFEGSPWMKVYARSVIENCDLKPYYAARKGARFREWLKSLP